MEAFHARFAAATLLCTLSLGGCTLLSRDGPEGDVLPAGAAAAGPDVLESLPYVLVQLDADVVVAANESPSETRRFSSFRGDVGSDVSIGVGDVVAVTLFEAESGGLFIPKDAAARPGNFVQLPNEQVDSKGNITVPYIADPVHVAGRSPEQASLEISEKLKARAIEPQAVVSVVEHRGNAVSVLGEVAAPTRFSLDPGGIRLTGAIARAGGPKYPAYETLVTVKRRGVVQTAEMTEVVKTPSQDIGLAAGDVVYLSHEPKVYMVLGATPSPGALGGVNNRRFTFENEQMSLAEAISKAGGLDSTRSDPASVFLFRFEPTDLLRREHVNVSKFPYPRAPTVYKVDLATADGFFLADKFQIRDKDVIFVAQAADVDISKFLAIAVAATAAADNAGTAAWEFAHVQK